MKRAFQKRKFAENDKTAKRFVDAQHSGKKMEEAERVSAHERTPRLSKSHTDQQCCNCLAGYAFGVRTCVDRIVGSAFVWFCTLTNR